MKKHPLVFLSAVGNACVCILTHQVSSAQIVPDTTLPVNSILTNQGNTSIIEGGTSAGGNLFHSFTQFSIPTNGTAFFNNNLDIQNIFSRVTGGSISNIDGIIQANGTANLFLLNPNGIIFGPNARLNIGGSFLASTGTRINFADGTQFSATPNQTTPLLTVSVPIGLQIGNNPGQIQVQNTGHNWNYDAESGLIVRGEKLSGLQVQPGKSLALIGGNVNLEGGILQAAGGRIELGGLAAEGIVGINTDGSLNFSENLARADVLLANKAVVNAIGAGGGSIGINSRNLDILGNSLLAGGIGENSGSVGSQAGNITIDSTGNINIGQLSIIENRVNPNGIGNSGNIDIKAASLSLTDGSFMSGSSFGLGNGGDINVNLSESLTISGKQNESYSRIASSVSNGIGNGGSINIAAKSVFLTDGAINTFTSGKGDAGSISVAATDVVSLAKGFIYSDVGSKAVGNAGNINISAASISLTNEASIDSSSVGQGNAGNIFLTAKDSVSLVNSNIFSNVGSEYTNNVGNIRIQAGSLSLTENAQIQAGISSGGRGNPGIISVQVRDNVTLAGEGSAIFSNIDSNSIGNGGDIEISAGSISFNGGQLVANTAGQGNAGNVLLQVRDSVTLSGENSAIFNNVLPGAVGNGGSITIQANTVNLTNSAFLNSSSYGQGNAGNIVVAAKDAVSLANGYIYSNVGSEYTNNIGNIRIEAGSLSLTEGGQIQAGIRSEGRGNPGIISVQVRDNVTISGEGSAIYSDAESKSIGNGSDIEISAGSVSFIDGGGLVANAAGKGNGGSITIEAGSLFLTDRSTMSAVNVGEGKAGDISLQIRDSISITNNSFIASSLLLKGVGEGGSINIETGSLFLDNNSFLATQSNGQGNAGSISVEAKGAVSLANESSILSSLAKEAVGNGGSITLQAGSVSLSNQTYIDTSNYGGRGDAGSILVQATGAVSLANQSSIGSSLGKGAVGDGGKIEILASSVSLSDRSSLDTSNFGERGDAGNILVKTTGIVSLANKSGIGSSLSEESVGNGGSITIEAGLLFLTDRSDMSANSFGEGKAGEVSIQIQDAISITNNSFIASSFISEKAGKGGSIDIQTGSLSLDNNSFLSTLSSGQGDAGSISVEAIGAVSLANASSILSSLAKEGVGNSGNITLQASSVSLSDRSQVTVSSEGNGAAGNLSIKANSVSLNNFAALSADTPVGKDANITVESRSLTLGNNSRITTNATGEATGGNITLNTDVLAALENSDINANAQQASGGRIIINSQGIFGTQFREFSTPESDITATSELGAQFSGTVTINTPDVDPSSGLINLPGTVVDATNLVASSCNSRSGEPSQFTVTGRGGLPPNPLEAISDEATWIDLRPSLISNSRRSSNSASKNSQFSVPNSQIVEATGWAIEPDGKLRLTASTPNVTLSNLALTSPSC